MSVDLHLNISGDDEARKRISDKVDQCSPSRVAKQVLSVTREHWKRHLQHLPQNKKGYPSTGFWQEAAKFVGSESYSVGGRVLLQGETPKAPGGLRQRLHGGEIKARNHKYLTIPICAEAYGTRVADWGIDNLTLVINRATGFRFFALWLGNGDVAKKFEGVVGKDLAKFRARKAKWEEAALFGKGAGGRFGRHAADITAQNVNRFRASTAFKKPDVIILNGKSAHTQARAERHMNLKFLFLLVESVNQMANPNVIPPDLGAVALEATLEATK